MSNYIQLAQFSLAVMGKATIQADDQTINATVEARNMLHAIANGDLIVYPKPVAAKLDIARGGTIVPAGGAPPIFDGEENG